jgi:hypothetical protein
LCGQDFQLSIFCRQKCTNDNFYIVFSYWSLKDQTWLKYTTFLLFWRFYSNILNSQLMRTRLYSWSILTIWVTYKSQINWSFSWRWPDPRVSLIVNYLALTITFLEIYYCRRTDPSVILIVNYLALMIIFLEIYYWWRTDPRVILIVNYLAITITFLEICAPYC